MIPTVRSAAAHSPDHGNLAQRIPHIAVALKLSKVTCVRIKYDGRFDRGAMEDPVCLTGEGVPIDVGIPRAMRAELRVFFSELLELRFPEWDNAEGARGEFQWDLGLDRLAQAHIVRSTRYAAAVVIGL